MAVEDSTEIEAEVRAEVKEAREWQSIEKERDRQLQRDLKKLDLEGNVTIKKAEEHAAVARLRSTTRVDVWRRFLIALVKLPILPFAVIFVFTLEMFNHDPLESLDDFISL